MEDVVDIAQSVFAEQSKALCYVAEKLSHTFKSAIDLILECDGRVIVSGMGKSGIIGKKISATFSSTGTPSFYLHPGEAFHGDLGMIKSNDILLLISYSGETDEIIRLLPSLNNSSNKTVAIVGNSESTLAKYCDCVLDIGIDREVCPNNLAPTTSTTVTATMGDALAVTLMQCRNFQPQDFAKFHPGGNLGKKLLTRVKDLMHKDNLPLCNLDTTLHEAISIMTKCRSGAVVIINDNNNVLGIFTDGDLRRTMLDCSTGVLSKTMGEVMTANPKTISQETMIVEAEERMLRDKITLLVAVDDAQNVVGLLEIYDR